MEVYFVHILIVMKQRKTKRKKKYYICEHNPETCNYISWNKPKIGEKWEPEKEKEVTKPKRKTRKKK